MGMWYMTTYILDLKIINCLTLLTSCEVQSIEEQLSAVPFSEVLHIAI